MGSGASPHTASSSKAVSTNHRTQDSSDLSMRDLENEIVDISSTSQGIPSSKVKLLFAKSKVYVHPTPRAKDNIPGWFALVEKQGGPSSSSVVTRKNNILISWIPETLLPASDSECYVKVELSDGDRSSQTPYSTKADVLVPPPPLGGMYAFSIPLSRVFSLLVRPPRIGWWSGSLVINERGGMTHPALFFHDAECKSTQLAQKRRQSESFDPFGAHGDPYWGGDEVLKWLQKYVTVQRSTLEPQLYLIDPSTEDLLSLSPSPSSTPPLRSSDDGTMDPITARLKEARWSLLEKFARVTAFGRRTAADILEQPIVREQILPRLPPQMRNIVKSKEVQRYVGEYDSAREYLARWAAGVAEEAEREKSKRGEEVGSIWGSRRQSEGWEELSELGGGYQVLSNELPERVERKKPLDERTWKKFFDHTGHLAISAVEVKEAVFHGGVDPSIRPEVWKFLLGLYPWNSSGDERKAIRRSKRDEYVRLKAKWWDGFDLQADPWFIDQKSRIEKDVHRTDRTISPFMEEDLPHPDPDSQYSGTNAHLEMLKDMLMTYNMYDNKEVGYVQGMSDLLSVIYAIMQDDSDAFWCFCGFMERMKYNFLMNQNGMRRQLLTLKQLTKLMIPKLYAHLEKSGSDEFFFLFRQILVWFKREFSWDDVCSLWEVLWTDYLSGQFHLFIALAILDKHKDVIMEHLREFDEVLKYINDLSMTIDLESTLIRAEVLFYRFQGTVELIDRKNAENAKAGKEPEVKISDELRGLLKKQYPKE